MTGSELVGRRYSISMDLQGAVIERLSGQSLPGFLREHIFEPLRRRAALYYTGGPLRLLPVPNRRSAVAPTSGTVRPAPGSWVDPQHDLFYIGMIQLLSSSAPPLQKITQALLTDAILDPGTTP